jgi:hypothetical protein
VITQHAWVSGSSFNDIKANLVQLGSNLHLAGPRIGRRAINVLLAKNLSISGNF